MTSDPVSPAPRRSSPLLLTAIVAALAGLIVGGLGGYLIFSDGGSSDRGAQNVDDGCSIIERVEDEFPLDRDSIDLDEPLIFELGGAGQIFMAADRADDSLASISQSGRDLTTSMSRLDIDGANDALDELVEECGDR